MTDTDRRTFVTGAALAAGVAAAPAIAQGGAKAPTTAQAAAYPKPLIGHREARERALEAGRAAR